MKKIISTIIAICFLISFTSCESSTIRLICDINGEPQTLDPQYASDTNALTIIQNSFEGLFMEDENGDIIKGVINSYDVSADGLKYTFELKKNLEWSNGYPLTAHDFEFSFKRLFDPVTESNTGEPLYCIKNSKSIRNGKISVDKLGVKATSNTTLVIELDYVNAMFIELLASAPAMPCNEKFFNETKGEYGLEASSIIANGPFEVTVWSHTEYIKLMKNNYYYAQDDIYLNNMTLWLNASHDNKLRRFGDDSTHCLTFEGDLNETFGNVSKMNIKTNVNSTWGIVFNTESEYFKNENLRKAISECIDRNRVESDLPSFLTVADYLIPDKIVAGDLDYREYVQKQFGDYSQPMNVSKAKEYYKQALKELDKTSLNDIFIIIPESMFIEHESYFNNLSQIVQKHLNLFIGLEVLSQSDYNKRVSAGSYDIAIAKVEAEYNNPMYILNEFLSTSDKNISNYSNSDYDKLLSNALSQNSAEKSIEYLKLAEEKLISSAVIIPLYYQDKYLLLSDTFTGIKLSEKSGLINFRFTKMK